MYAGEEWPSDGLEVVERCPVCGDQRRTLLHQGLIDRVFRCAPGVWSLHRCRGCGSAYLDPRPTEATIGRAYAVYYTHGAPAVYEWPRAPAGAGFLRRLRAGADAAYLNARYGYDFRPALPLGSLVTSLSPRARERADRWARHMPRPAGSPSLLDVGCAGGEFLLQMKAAGWSVAGIDPDPQAVARAAGAGLEVVAGHPEEETFPEGSFDAITMSHVIEHLHDPVRTLRLCHRYLKPGGVLWIATPNLESRGHARFGEYWIGLDPPRHLVLFTSSSLAAAVGEAGFDVVREPSIRVGSWTFSQCAALEQGRDPFSDRPKLGAGLALRARLADLAVLLGRPVGEDVIVLARRS